MWQDIIHSTAMEKYKTLFINVAIFSLNIFATKIISILLVPLYTEYLSAAEFGITDMSLTVINLVTPLATLSIADAAMRFLIDDKIYSVQYVSIAIFLTAGSILLVAIFCPLLDLPLFGGLGRYKGLFVFAYSSSAFYLLCGELARGLGKIKLIPLCAATSSVITFLCAAFFIVYMRLGVLGYFLAVSLGPLASTLIFLLKGGLLALFKTGIRQVVTGKNVYVNRLHRMLGYSIPLIPNSLFWWMGTSISRFFITSFSGIAASGLFAAAGKLPNLLNTAYSVFQQAWQLSAFQESRSKEIGQFYSTVFGVLQAIITILCSLIILFTEPLAVLFLRGETFSAWKLIPTLILANLFSVLNSFYGTVYTATLRTTYIMKTTVVGAAIVGCLSPLLISLFGLCGACWSSVVAQGAVFVLRAFDSRKYISFHVNWISLLLTVFLLFVQSILSVDSYTTLTGHSLILTALIIAIQLIQIVVGFKRQNR